MNSLRNLAQQEGCSVDGTAAVQNPLAQLANQVLGMGQQKGAPGGALPGGAMAHLRGQGPAQQHFAQQNEIERAMAMGQMPGMPTGPMMQGPMTGGGMMSNNNNTLANEFMSQFRQPLNQQPLMHQRQQQLHHHQEQQWIRDFQSMNMGVGDVHAAQARRGWAAEMARGPPPPSVMEQAWRQQHGDGQSWASELKKQQPKEPEDVSGSKSEAEKAAATRKDAEDMVRVLSQNSKLRDSEFFDFMSKLSTGELKFDNNEVVAGEGQSTMGAAWEDASKTTGDAAEDAWIKAQSEMEEAFKKAWEGGGDLQEADYERFMSKMMQQGGYEALESAWQREGELEGLDWASQSTALNGAETPYELAADNPYAESNNAYQEGLQLFKQGRLQDAVLAFQAAVSKDVAHADAWRMLGVVHQENDEDKKAIACLERAVEQDAYHLDALLGLGVSYVNELNHDLALKNLKAWVVNNPAFQGLEVKPDAYSDGSMQDDVMQLMLKAAEWAPHDAGVQEVLGVLFNVARDYESATAAFRKALTSRPDDYSLWNKVGATLANGSRSEEAIPAYRRAIELRPGYARGHLNLGISYSNLGDYANAARSYLRALELSPSATHIWSYLKMCFSCMDRNDLAMLCERRDLPALKKSFEF